MQKSAAKITPSVSTECIKFKPKTPHEKEVAVLKAALNWAGETKKSVIEALRLNGLAGNSVNVERVQILRSEFIANRKSRQLNRANARISTPIKSLPCPSGRRAINLPEGTPAQRLTKLRKFVVTNLAKDTFRYGASGGTRFSVKIADTSADVNYSVKLDTNYDLYGGSYKGWAANVDCHTMSIPRDWRIRVQRKGLAQLSGMLTLDAHPMEAPAGLSLYAAVWARQARGYDVKIERGYIAVSGQESFHAETAEQAIYGLRRKCNAVKKNSDSNSDFSSSVESFIAKYSHFKIEVGLDDAVKSGSCEYGIHSWCESVGIDINRVKVPMAELLDGFRKLPLCEVRRSVLYSVRKIKRHR